MVVASKEMKEYSNFIPQRDQLKFFGLLFKEGLRETVMENSIPS
jgi:hypothetical protein